MSGLVSKIWAVKSNPSKERDEQGQERRHQKSPGPLTSTASGRGSCSKAGILTLSLFRPQCPNRKCTQRFIILIRSMEYVLLAKLKVHWRFFELHKHFSKLRLHRKEVRPKFTIHINPLIWRQRSTCYAIVQPKLVDKCSPTANTQDILFSAPGKVTRKSFAASIAFFTNLFLVCAFPYVSLFCAWSVHGV